VASDLNDERRNIQESVTLPTSAQPCAEIDGEHLLPTGEK
jgi:hypothetical protein